MASFLHTHLVVILVFSLFLTSAVAIENENTVIALPISENAKKTTACNEKSSDSVTCPVSCFRADPVCGINGITYWCGCAEAQCAGVEVAKIGFCEVGNGGSGLLSGQALLLVHIVWLILLGFSVLIGLP
ncbi:hypothetical protein SUGI_0588990 [Cryptomeria japonica]|uniref:uncharacterized protein LOC131072859 n=1 Tax=Cryptomeria japonica TaxID=3369 RepID=UPI0024149738|nr:uncharacterized protein LOC131072859 [Cryptomeria japonica]GLJ29827.1 hypothetical protein SUGI_0588990 [Cryptomeria japonica]